MIRDGTSSPWNRQSIDAGEESSPLDGCPVQPLPPVSGEGHVEPFPLGGDPPATLAVRGAYDKLASRTARVASGLPGRTGGRGSAMSGASRPGAIERNRNVWSGGRAGLRRRGRRGRPRRGGGDPRRHDLERAGRIRGVVLP